MVELSALKQALLVCVIINSTDNDIKAEPIKARDDIKFQLYVVDLDSLEGLIMLNTSKYTYQANRLIPYHLPV